MSLPILRQTALFLGTSLILTLTLSGCSWFSMLAVPQEPSTSAVDKAVEVWRTTTAARSKLEFPNPVVRLGSPI